MCSSDFERLKNWKPRFNVNNHDELTPNGRTEMNQLGLRMRTRLIQQLLWNTASVDQVDIRTADSGQTHESASEYASGILGWWPLSPEIKTVTADRDYLLDYAGSCEKFLVVRKRDRENILRNC